MSSNIPQKMTSKGIPRPTGSTASTQPNPAASAPSNWQELEAKYKQDIENLEASTEMAITEKEMTEIKLDICEKELKEIKDKLTEATLQIEMIKGDKENNQSMGASNTDSSVTIYQLQKVEEQNELLKQAVIKLRDISAKDKKSLEELQIQNEDLQEKLLDLEEKEQKYLDQVKNYEEQIDVNQSAQEMVEKLTQQKSELEDRLKELIDDVDCMEKLRDLNEQLLESARENEIELTEELDKMRVQIVQLNNKRRDMEDYLSDQERTVAKLKDDNRQLNDQVNRLKERFREGESIEQQKHQIENVAYKLNHLESKISEKDAEISRCRRNLADMEVQMSSLSMITKEQSSQIDDLKMQIDLKSSENAELQRALKKKTEEVSELEIRREIAEKRLASIQRDTDTKFANLNKTIETMKSIELQHDEEIRRLMDDCEIIEKERRELRDQLNKSNRSLERSIQAGNHSISMVTAHDTSLASLGISFQTNTATQSSNHNNSMVNISQMSHASVAQHPPLHPSQAAYFGPSPGLDRNLSDSGESDDPMVFSKLRSLNAAFDKINKKNYELEMEFALRELDKRAPPYIGTSLSSVYDIDRAKALQSEVMKLKREVRMAMINQQICKKSRNILSHIRNERFCNAKLSLKYQILENEASTLMSSSNLARSRPMAPLLQSTPVKH